MSSSSIRNGLVVSVFLGIVALPVKAQGSAAPSNDSLFRRARRLVAEGNGVAGRALVDSILKSNAEGSPVYGDALYWRGALAETAADAERDYRRVIVEYPLSAYSDNALLGMADLESARGDRAGALQHLQRFVKEHAPTSPARGAAALSAARLAFEQRDSKAGCAMIVAARASTPATNVEARNQIEYLANRCSPAELATASDAAPATTVVTPPASAPPSTPVKAPVPAVSAPSRRQAGEKSTSGESANATKGATTPPVTPPDIARPPLPATVTQKSAEPAPVKRGTFTIQLAAYNTRADAERLVAKLKTRGVAARVSGEAKPFRVRLDFYATRQTAQEEVNALRARGIVGFVTTEDPPPTATP